MTEIVNRTADTNIPRFALKLAEARVAAGVSRSRLYEAIRNRKLTARKAGKATLILVDDLKQWLNDLPVSGDRAA